MDPLGDSAIVVQLGNKIELQTHKRIQVLCQYLDKHPLPGMVEYIPSFTNITIFYDGLQVNSHQGSGSLQNFEWKAPYGLIQSMLNQVLKNIDESGEYTPKLIEIPVCYGDEFGPDLEFVAKVNGLTPDEVVRIHSAGEYLTYMVGFAPGFPYLGGLSERIAAPRRETPRLKIPAGTVGIAGTQTGVYPIETPGGWQLIGKTPISLFRPKQWPPTLLQAGNIVKFVPISRQEFDRWKEAIA